jgi:hypothetical protein
MNVEKTSDVGAMFRTAGGTIALARLHCIYPERLSRAPFSEMV